MLRADAYDLKTIFEKQRKHKVPLFQRRYVWDMDRQWEPLWEDIQAVAEGYLEGGPQKSHFLGAVVLKQDETPSKEIETRLVIDGQQRLITLQLVISATRDVLDRLGPEFVGLRRNLHFHVANQAGLQTEDDVFKVWPTQADQGVFRAVLTAGSPDRLRELLPEDDSPIREAYLYFIHKIDSWVSNHDPRGGPSRAEALHNALLRGLIVVVIDLSLDDDAQVIFESLNARGTPLLQSELVKNFLLHSAEQQQMNSTKLHAKYWEPFESDSFWQDEVKQGRLYRQRIEVFLQHYLTMHMTREVSAIALFDTFRSLASRHPQLTPQDHLVRLHHYGRIFQVMAAEGEASPHRTFFYRIRIMEVSTLFPLLLFLLDRLDDPEAISQRRTILTDLESFLVRRMICGLTTKQYNKLFLDLQSQLQAQTGDLAAVARGFLLSRTADSEFWPEDSVFQEAWSSQPLYRRITRSRLRMILEAIEAHIRTRKTEDASLPKKLTIEHLLPRDWGDHWPLAPDESRALERRTALLHTIGNLTLLTSSLNPSISNSPWNNKRREILKHSVLKLNAYFQDVEEWSEAQIERRGQVLFQSALEIWPRPA